MSGLRLAGAIGVLVAAGLGLVVLTANPPPRPLKSLSRAGLETQDTITKIALGSSLDQQAPAPIWDTIRAERPELFIAMGDNVCVEAGPEDAELKGLRSAYDGLARERGFRRLLKEVPVLPIWDDLDYGRNDAGGNFPFKAESKALFLRFWGIPRTAARYERPGLYDSLIIGTAGRRIQIILLDTRWFRDALARGTGGARFGADPDPAKTLLGAAQWAWLEGELKKEAEIRLIVSSIPVEAEAGGFERWGNFPAERDRLFALIAKTRANDVIFLSGGRHEAGIYKSDIGTPYPLFELGASPLNKPQGSVEEADASRIGPLYPHENYGLLTIDWHLKTVRLEIKDLKGEQVMAASAPLARLRPPAPTHSFVQE